METTAAVAPSAPSAAPPCPQCAGATAPTGMAPAPPQYVYAMGKVEVRFPSVDVEKELIQVRGNAETRGLSDRQVLYSILAERSSRYLVRRLTWVLTVEGLETYILVPRDPMDLELLVNTVRAEPTAGDHDVVVGVRGPLAPPEMSSGLVIPVVAFDQLYSFDRAALVKSIPRPETLSEERFTAAAGELLDRIMQLSDNSGATDEHRALNYLSVRYPAIYTRTTEAFGNDFSLTGVEVRRSRLSGARNVVDVIFSYTNRKTDMTEKYFVRVDVTEMFPFLVTKLAPYYDR
jgi:hypothetical protein